MTLRVRLRPRRKAAAATGDAMLARVFCLLTMLRITELRLPIDHDPAALRLALLRCLGIESGQLRNFSIYKRSYDARKKQAMLFVYSVDAEVIDEPGVLKRLRGNRAVMPSPDTSYHFVAKVPAGFSPPHRPVVVGFGPCGIFAALILAQMGLRPIVIERGKMVRERTQDTWGLWRRRELNPESNVQFGEGGAGTFSDGKLYSQIKDPRFLGRKVMAEFVRAGAPPEIMYARSRTSAHFDWWVWWSGCARRSLRSAAKSALPVTARRSADRGQESCAARSSMSQRTSSMNCAPITWYWLWATVPAIRLKCFSGAVCTWNWAAFFIGFRIEHPQSLIDRARLGPNAGHPEIGAADYKLVHHASNGRSVYSFCMCPGGTVVAHLRSKSCGDERHEPVFA